MAAHGEDGSENSRQGKSSRVQGLVFVVVAAAFVAPSVGFAAQFCVPSPSGATPGGKCDNVFASEATALAGPGDEIVLGAGVFRETLRPGSGTADRPLRIRGAGPNATVLSGADPLRNTQRTGAELRAAYTPPCSGCGQVFLDGVELPRLRWPDEPPARFARTFGHVISAEVRPEGEETAVINVRVAEVLPDWVFLGGRAAIAEGGEWRLLPGRIIAADRTRNTLQLRVKSSADTLHPKSGNRIELFPVGSVPTDTPSRPFWTSDEGEKFAFLHVPERPGRDSPNLEVKTRSIALDLSQSSHVVVENLGVFAAAVRTGDDSQDVELRNLRVDYGLSRLPTELTSHGWYVEGDREAAVELRGRGNRLLDSTIEDSMGNGLLILGHDSHVAGNTILDTNRAGLELAAISFGPNIGSAGHLVEDNVLLRSGRHMISHRGLRGGEIRGNLVERWGLLTYDTGGSYVNGADCAGTVIDQNWFEGSSARYGVGIYLDDHSRGCVVRDNVTIGADYGVWMGNTDAQHKVEDNFAVGRTAGLGVFVPKGDSLTLNGTVIVHNQISPRVLPEGLGAGENRIHEESEAALRADALAFAAAHGFPASARPATAPTDK